MQVLTPADDIHHINKHNFKVPFVCGCRDLGEALRRVAEGAAMIRTKVPSPLFEIFMCPRRKCRALDNLLVRFHTLAEASWLHQDFTTGSVWASECPHAESFCTSASDTSRQKDR